ncbi:MAG: biotin--[acetyl-CoA-carboxylase] ligase [Phycisphaerae bacterium]
MQRAHLTEIDSTNLEAVRRWRVSDQAHPFLITATVQTAGRGRHDRPWQSPPGGLWLTVAWPLRRPPAHYTAVPLAAGAAIALALEETCGVRPQIKWPNDVLIAGRKVAGVLVQMELAADQPAAIVGVGLNGNFAAADLGPDLLYPATSLQDELGRPVDLDAVLAAAVGQLEALLVAYDRDGPAACLPDVRSRLAWLGEQVRAQLITGGPPVVGRIAGLADDGSLLLDAGDRQHRVSAGEIARLRP